MWFKWLSSDNVILFFQLAYIIFGLYLVFQILLKLFGGSWSAEGIIMGLVIANVSVTFAIGILLTQVRSDLRHLRSQFRSLANDFKRTDRNVERLLMRSK